MMATDTTTTTTSTTAAAAIPNPSLAVAAGATTMAAESFRKIHPEKFYHKFLRHNLRPDGRKLFDFRKVSFEKDCFVHTSKASSIIRLGNTTVACSVKTQFANPPEESPDAGFFVPTVRFSTVGSNKSLVSTRRKTTDLAACLTTFIDSTIKQNKVIDLQQLCIVPEKLSWVLYADIEVIDNDGCLEDACLLSIFAAIKEMKLPLVDIDEEEGTITPSLSQYKPLRLGKLLVSCTFAVISNSAGGGGDYDDEQDGAPTATLVADPTREESKLSNSIITVVVSNDKNICALLKSGDSNTNLDIVDQSIQSAFKRSLEIFELIS